jgi:hypothetical protein
MSDELQTNDDPQDAATGDQAVAVDLEALIEERDTAIAERDAALAELDKLKKAPPKVATAPKPAKPRKLGPVADQPPASELLDAIREAEQVEIAFSNGKTENVGLDPIVVTGDAWAVTAGRLAMTEPLMLNGPAPGSSFALHGYALILDGKQVAYSQRSDVLTLAGGRQYNLTGDVIF